MATFVHQISEKTSYCFSPSVGASPVAAVTVAPFRGFIINLFGVTAGTVTTADATVSTAINGTAITGGNFTITSTGSTVGSYFEVGTGTIKVPVNENDRITFTPSGGSGANVPATFGVTFTKS